MIVPVVDADQHKIVGLTIVFTTYTVLSARYIPDARHGSLQDAAFDGNVVQKANNG